MPHKTLKKILAGYSIAGLLSVTVFIAGCSKQEETDEKPEDQQTSQQRSVIVDKNREKPTKPDGTEVKIRGKSG